MALRLGLSGYNEDPVSAGLNSFGKVLTIANSLEEMQQRREDRPMEKQIQQLKLTKAQTAEQQQQDEMAEWNANKPLRQKAREAQNRQLWDSETGQNLEGGLSALDRGEDLSKDQATAVMIAQHNLHPDKMSAQDIEDLGKEVDTLYSGLQKMTPALTQIVSKEGFKGGAITRGMDISGVKADDVFNSMGQVYNFSKQFPDAKSATINRLILSPDPSGKFKAIITPEMQIVDKDGNSHTEPLQVGGKVVQFPAEMFMKDVEGKKKVADGMNNLLIQYGREGVAKMRQEAVDGDKEGKAGLAAEKAVLALMDSNPHAGPAQLENAYATTYRQTADNLGLTMNKEREKAMNESAKRYNTKVQKVFTPTKWGVKGNKMQYGLMDTSSGEQIPEGDPVDEFKNTAGNQDRIDARQDRRDARSDEKDSERQHAADAKDIGDYWDKQKKDSGLLGDEADKVDKIAVSVRNAVRNGKMPYGDAESKIDKTIDDIKKGSDEEKNKPGFWSKLLTFANRNDQSPASKGKKLELSEKNKGGEAGGEIPGSIVTKAQAAINAGAPADKVRDRLKRNGYSDEQINKQLGI